jgi:type I restriction enzyme M protein
MSLSHNEIANFIFKIADKVLRGPFKEKEYGAVILPFILLRRLDCVLEEHKDKVIELHKEFKSQVDDVYPIISGRIKNKFYNYSHFDLNRLRQDPNNVLINFNNYLNSYSDNVIEIIRNFEFDKPLKRLEDNDRLFQFIEIFSEIDLHPNEVSNHQMGQIFEELLRRYSELSNESSGQHYTPRDIVNLLVSLIFTPDSQLLKGDGIIRSIYDPCCGTGGMLTLGKDWALKNINNELEFRLLGQEFNPETYSICKSDMMISGDNPENIKYGSSLSQDGFVGDKFDYMITNPPYGDDWYSDKDFVKNEAENPDGRFSAGVPKITDGQLLFVQHLISKMEANPKGSRIGVVLNASPFFTGDAGSGESEIRKWIIENDWLECIISLPGQLFFNTPISTFIWILSNRKESKRKGKIQLIDGSSSFKRMKKSLGQKRNKITEIGCEQILETYMNFSENEHSQIHDNDFFGYTRVCIEQPLIENGKIVTNKQGKPKLDSSKRDFERIPLKEDIDEFFDKEVKPNLPDAWIDLKKNKVGYIINFNKYFYKFKSLRALDEISSELMDLDEESRNLLQQIIDK